MLTVTTIDNTTGTKYTETISEEECRNPGSDQDRIHVSRNQLSFLVYRANETTIYVENTTSRSVNFRLVSLSGKVIYHGEAEPGHNEISFLGTGIYLARFFGDGVYEKYKAFL